jgi:hypothetical protein
MSLLTGSLPHVTGLILSGGNITIGRVEPLDGIAVAADAATVLATLVRPEDETVEELLRRLDAAVGQAVQSGAAVNEIKGAELLISAPTAHKRRKSYCLVDSTVCCSSRWRKRRIVDSSGMSWPCSAIPANWRIDSTSYSESSACGSDRLNQFCMK